MNAPAPRSVAFDDLDPYLLLRNGNFLYKLPLEDGFAVLKVYSGSRGRLGELQKSLGNVLIKSQTSYLATTRCRVERECLELWRKHGFRTFRIRDDVRVDAPGCVPGTYLLLEYVDATRLIDVFRDGTPFAEKMRIYRRFLPEWSRRHELAIATRDPRLVHENGDAKHVMLTGDSFLWFDLEIAYRSPARIEDYVAHEILQYLWHSLKQFQPDEQEEFLQLTIESYPERDRLRLATDRLLAHPNPFHRAARIVHRHLRPSARKPSSKYAVARRLRAALAG